MRNILIGCLMFLGGTSMQLHSQQLDLVKDGKSDYEIIVSPSALPAALKAAEDLKLHIKKVSGADLPLKKADAISDKPAIVVGDGALSKAAGIDVSKLQPEAFIIKTSGKNLFIAGKDTPGDPLSVHWRSAPQCGTWNGAATFIEQELGVRWFFPGADGEYIPKNKNISIKPMDFSDAPKMILRRMTYLTNNNTSPARNKEVSEWMRRNKQGWSIVWNASHTWIENFKGETYFKEHPEWFAMVDGRRLSHNEHGLQMCTTNKAALDEFSKVAMEYSKKNNIMFSLSPNDGGNHCECIECKKIDTEYFQNKTPKLADRYVKYCNEVAERVCKEIPDQKFGFYAYSYYEDPPLKNTKLHSNVYVMNAFNEINVWFYNKDIRDYQLNKRLIPWGKISANLFFYSHPEGFGGIGEPEMAPTVIKELFKMFVQSGIKGYMMCNSASFASTGLNNYLDLKMSWDPAADFDAVNKDAMEKCYGKIALPVVQKYYDDVEKRHAEMANKIKFTPDNSDCYRYPVTFEILLKGLHAQHYEGLKKAMDDTNDPGQKARIKLLVDNLAYIEDVRQLYEEGSVLTKAKNPDMKDILKCRDAAVRHYEWLKVNDNTNLAGCTNTTLNVEKMFYMPFNPSIYNHLIASAGGKKASMNVKPLKAPLKVDGDLSKTEWKDIPAVNANLSKDDGSPVSVATFAKVSMDREFLYIAVHCEEPLMNKITDSVNQKNGKVWAENNLEFFFDTANARKGYVLLCVNTLGAVFEKKYASGKEQEWNSDAIVSVKKNADSWDAEIAIPLKSFGTEIKAGDIWGMNICRVRNTVTPLEYSCWSPTLGGFHIPEQFGKMIFFGNSSK